MLEEVGQSMLICARNVKICGIPCAHVIWLTIHERQGWLPRLKESKTAQIAWVGKADLIETEPVHLLESASSVTTLIVTEYYTSHPTALPVATRSNTS